MEAIIFFAFLFLLSPGALGDGFLDECKIRVEGILDGTVTYGLINNETIDEYIHRGPVAGINSSFPLKNLTRVTRDGTLSTGLD